MQNAVVVKGRLIGPKSVELDEPVAGANTDVEVLIRLAPEGRPNGAEAIADFLDRLPAGTRSKEDIDEQLRAERASWGDR